MKTLNFNSLTDALGRTEQALRKLAVGFKQWLPQASWLEILLVCIPLALAVTLLPVVLTLFVLGLVGKWLLAPSSNPHQEHSEQRPYPGHQQQTDIVPSENNPA